MTLRQKFLSTILAFGLCCSSMSMALADSNYDETNDGDLSGDRQNPTAVTLTLGNNTVTATSFDQPEPEVAAAAAAAVDVDYLAVTVPDGHQIEAIIVDAYTFDTAPVANRQVVATSFDNTALDNTVLDDTAFIAVQSGSIFTEPPTGTDVSNLLGYSHFGPSLGHVGTDILDDIAAGEGAIGFVGTLQESQYTFWMQQTGPTPTTYTLNFVVSALTPTASETVEEPSSLAPQIYIPLFGG